MTGEITLGLKDILAVVIGLGGPIAVYVGMREQITTLTAEVRAMRDIVAELRAAKGDHGDSLGEVREELAGLRVRISTLEQTRTGSFPTFNPDASGPHKVVP